MLINADTIRLLQPELILVVFAIAIMVCGAFWRAGTMWAIMALAGIGLAGLALWPQLRFASGDAAELQMMGPMAVDLLCQTMRMVALVLGGCFVLAAAWDHRDGLLAEVLGMLMLVTVGMMLVCGAGELTLLFLGLELISIPTYVLLFIGRGSANPQEATLKYFFLSILSSSLLLYGLSMLYGASGSTSLVEIRDVITTNGQSARALLTVATVLILAGLCFKIAAVPFHFYAPDVYQATSHLNAGVLAVVPKLAGFVALVRLLTIALPTFSETGWKVALVLAVLTMTVGNVCALWQNNLRRLMAYSSIAHTGYMLIGLAVGAAALDQVGGQSAAVAYSGFSACLLYLMVYAIASLGTFAALAHWSTAGRAERVDDLAGMGRWQPWVAVAVAIFMFSLSGIPPLVGFFGKMTLFLGALTTSQNAGSSGFGRWFLALAVIGVLNAAIAAAYYLRIVGVMYFGTRTGQRGTQRWTSPGLVALLCASALVVTGFFPGPLVSHFGRLDNGVTGDTADTEVTPPTASTKSEDRNPKQIQITKIPMTKT